MTGADETPDTPTPASDPPIPASDPMRRAILEGTTSGIRVGPALPADDPELTALQDLRRAVQGGRRSDHATHRSRAMGKNPTSAGSASSSSQKAHGGAEIDLSLLFADIRGSTGSPRRWAPASSAPDGPLLPRRDGVLVNHDAVVDKFVGDEVVALFIPALTGADMRAAAVEAARDAADRTGHPRQGCAWAPLGVGVHTGTACVGTVGDTVTDFTALGDTVNVTARLASAAAGRRDPGDRRRGGTGRARRDARDPQPDASRSGPAARRSRARDCRSASV